jgi:hypothetical protein
VLHVFPTSTNSCNFLQLPHTSSLQVPHILVNALSQVPSVCFHPIMRDISPRTPTKLTLL